MNLPKPSALREYEGDLSKGKVKPPIAEPIPITPMSAEPPAWLNDDARALWNKLYPEFAGMHLVKMVDTAKLATYVQLTVDFEKLTREINEEGYTKLATSSRGKTYEMVNPKTVTRNAIWPQLRVLGQLFGDSPGARAALGRDIDKSNADPLDAFSKPEVDDDE